MSFNKMMSQLQLQEKWEMRGRLNRCLLRCAAIINLCLYKQVVTLKLFFFPWSPNMFTVVWPDPDRKPTACTDWKGAALTLMPPVWVGLETGGKAEDREHGAGGCSGERDIEAWGGRKQQGFLKRQGNKDCGEVSARDGLVCVFYLRTPFYLI